MMKLPLIAICCAFAGMICIALDDGFSRAAEPTPPVVTAETARARLGQTATLELSVTTVKFAERRKLHFLSAAANFRSKSNLPVAIRDADIARFLPDGEGTLAQQYQGRNIRARGKVIEDEEQLLLLVTDRDQIEVLSKPQQPLPAANELVVVSESGERTILALPLAADLPRTNVVLEHDGAEEKYEGVLLAAVLAQAKTKLGAELRGELLARYVLVSAADGYAALLSLPEVDPFFTDQIVLLADRRNAQPLAAADGPLQLVVAGDKRRRRWVGQVARIEVRSAIGEAKRAETK